MPLVLFNSEQVAFTDQDKLRLFGNGHTGFTTEEKLYLRNVGDAGKWFTNISISVVSDVYDSLGELGTSGLGFKFIYGERRPTEAEWDVVRSGNTISFPNVGTAQAADESTFHPIWVRLISIRNTRAGINESFSLRLRYLPRLVGV